jgi:hypothetical protein
MNHWQKLIEIYANGKKICNCRRAYSTLRENGAWLDKKQIDWWVCEGGCGSAQMMAQDHVAEQILYEREQLINRTPHEQQLMDGQASLLKVRTE